MGWSLSHSIRSFISSVDRILRFAWLVAEAEVGMQVYR